MTSKIAATNKALSKINLDLTSITKSIDKGGGTLNDAHVLFAANVWSDTAGTAEYFFRLFNKLYDPVYDEQWWMGFTSSKATDSFDAAAVVIKASKAVEDAIASGATEATINSLRLELVAKEALLTAIMKSTAPKKTTWDVTKSTLNQAFKTYKVTNVTDDIDGEYSQTFSYATVTKTTTLGIIGSVGHYVKTLKAFSTTSSLDTALLPNFDTVSVSKQITLTEYETYTIYGMTTVNRVNYEDGGYKDIKNTVSIGVKDVNKKGTFVVPLFKNITKEMNDLIEERFLSDSLILYVQTINEIQLEWFQSDFFKWLIIIIVIIIVIVVTIFSGGTASPYAIYVAQGIIAALYATAIIVIQQIVIAVVISLILKAMIAILTPLIGVEAAAALTAIVAVAIMLYTGYGDAEFLADLPWAEVLLKTGACIVNTVASALDFENTQELLKLTAEMAGFTTYAGLVTKELDKGMDLLGTPIENLLYSTVNSLFIVKETPNDFYHRTIHQGNVGIMSIDAVSSYTHNKLLLPKEFPSYLEA
jgi:hypothetical protein